MMDHKDEHLVDLAGSVSDRAEVKRNEVDPNVAETCQLAPISQVKTVSRIAALCRRPESNTEAAKYTTGLGTWAHLELREKIGEGAYGRVYRAWDPTLEREVALKLYRSKEGNAGNHTALLLKEGRLLARIRHPNVVTVYGVDEFEGQIGLWMELVRGRTLEDLLQDHGPYGAREAAGIGLDLCRAVSAVHRAGLVHRDIKAQNVMREEGGRIVLMDLGLGGEQTMDETAAEQAFGGTPLYMAPELLAGSQATVRSDIYALGVLLYHLVTGSFPVVGRSLKDLRTAHHNGQVHLLRDRRPDLPVTFQQVIERVLSHDSEMRFSTVGQLERALAGPGGLDSSDPGPNFEIEPRGQQRRRLVFIASTGIVLFLLVLFLPQLSTWIGTSRPVIAEGSSVLLGDIENKTGDAQLNAVTDALHSELAQSAYFNLIDSAQVRAVLSRMVRPADQKLDLVTAREVAWREGTPLVISGTVSQLASNYILHLQLEAIGDKPDSPKSTWSAAFRAKSKDDIFEAIDEGSTWIRRLVGEGPRALAEKDLESRKATTDSWEALDLFSRAEKLKAQGSDDDALLLLRQAVEIDKDFALAHMRTGDILIALRNYSKGYFAWQQALHSMTRRRLTKREELRIEALYGYDTGDYSVAETRFKTYALHYPNNWEPLFYRAIILSVLGRPEESIGQFHEAAKRHPSAFQISAHLAMTHMLLGNFDRAFSYVERLRAQGHKEWADFIEGAISLAQRDFHKAAICFTALGQSSNVQWQSRGYAVRAALLAESGRYQDAFRLLDQGISLDARTRQSVMQADKLLAKAYLFYRKNNRSACREACLEAMRLEQSPDRCVKAGTLLARAGFPADAEQLLPHLDPDYAAPIFLIAKHRIRGEAQLARGNNVQALDILRRAEQLEPPTAPREYLARALRATGHLEESFRLYKAILDAPGRLWQYPDQEFPGIVADSIFQYAMLGQALKEDREAKQAFLQYLSLRKHADADFQEPIRTRKILVELR